MGKNKIRTIKYERLPIAKKSDYLCDEVIDEIEDSSGIFYEIRKTLNGELVAYQTV